MAQVDGVVSNFLTGPGEHGRMINIRTTLAAGVAKQIYFNGLKFSNYENVGVFFSDIQSAGVPGTITLATDGQSITLTDAGGGEVNMLLVGDLEVIK